MIIHIVATAIFWLNTFPPLKPGTGISNSKVPEQLFLGTVVYYKKVCRLHAGKYFQLHQEVNHGTPSIYIEKLEQSF